MHLKGWKIQKIHPTKSVLTETNCLKWCALNHLVGLKSKSLKMTISSVWTWREVCVSDLWSAHLISPWPWRTHAISVNSRHSNRTQMPLRLQCGYVQAGFWRGGEGHEQCWTSLVLIMNGENVSKSIRSFNDKQQLILYIYMCCKFLLDQIIRGLLLNSIHSNWIRCVTWKAHW